MIKKLRIIKAIGENISSEMAKLVEMDEHVTLARQMEEEDISGPIILFNRFTVNLEDVDGFLKAWTNDATLMSLRK
jgi:hypothetical protein